MSVQEQITRISNAKVAIKNKLVALGLADGTENITGLATEVVGITDRGTPAAEVREGETYTILAGYYHGGSVTGVAGGGSYNLQSKTATPTKAEQTISPDTGFYGLSSVKVNAIPANYQDVTNVTAVAGDVLATKVITTLAGDVTGTMPNNGAVSAVIDTSTTSYTVPAGYHSGAGTVSLVTETKTATPSATAQTISATAGKVISSVTVNAIPANWGNATGKTATAANILSGATAIGWDSEEHEAISLTGTMPNRGAVTASLDCGDTFAIAAGYHNGSGLITANSLASQTGVDTGKTAIAAGQVLAGYQGQVNGSKISGTMTNRGAVTATLDTTTTSYTIPTGYHNGSGTVNIVTETKTATPTASAQTISATDGHVMSSVTVNAIPSNWGDATNKTASAGDILYGATAIGWDSVNHTSKALTGSMPNNGAITHTLDCGESYTVPAGYHNGSGTVTASSLASQTGVDAGKTAIGASQVLTGYQGWVNGNKISGTMANNAAVSATLDSDTTSYTVPAGYHNGSGHVTIITETKTATPTEEAQTINATDGKVISSFTVGAIPIKYGDATNKTVTSADLLSGVTAIGQDSEDRKAINVTGSMANNGAVTAALNCGQTYTVPIGYHNGSGVITANSLASQTGVESGKTAITAAQVLTGYQGWVNGIRISGSMANNGAISATITGLGVIAGDTSYTIPAGYTSGGTVSLDSSIETQLAAI